MADSDESRSTRQTVHPAVGARISVATAAALLFVGGLAGYSLSLPGTERATPTTTTPAVAAAPNPAVSEPATTLARFDWVEQRPEASERRAWGVVASAELNDTIFLLAFNDFQTSEERVLWRSGNGTDWTQAPLDFGPDVIVDDIDVYGEGLLLSGWDSGRPTLWRSADPLSLDPTWQAISLHTSDLPGNPETSPQPSEAVPRKTDATGYGEIRLSTSEITTQVNSAGEVVVASRISGDITDMLLNLAGDPNADSLLHLDDRPEVAAAGQRLWARVKGADGSPRIQTLTMPDAVILEPTAGDYVTEVGQLTWGSIWSSTDGVSFRSVDLTGLPNIPTPLPLGDTFVSVIEQPNGDHDLWTSAAGSHWTRSALRPPSECGDWEGLAVSGSGMLLSNVSFDLMCASATGHEWRVRKSPQTALLSTGSVWLEGVDDGFVAVAQNRGEFAVLISEQGLEWRTVEFEPGTIGAHTMLVGDRLVASTLMIEPGSGERRFSVWVGTPLGS